MYLKNFIVDLCLPRILEKIYMSIYKFNNKRNDAVTTTFLLFTSQLCFFCNFYFTPYFSNIYFDILLKL